MTKQELAQTIKAKYPQYQNIDDTILVDKMLVKYPEYQTRITEATKESPLIARGQQLKQTFQDTASGKINPASTGIQTIGAVAGGVGDLLYAGIKTILPRATGALEKGIGKVASTEPAQAIAQKYSEWAIKNPEVSKDLESALNIAALMPAGKAGQLGVKGAEQGLKATGKALVESKPLLGKALATTGAIGEKTGTQIMAGSLVPTESQSIKTIAYNAKNPVLKRISDVAAGTNKAPLTVADVAMKYGLAGITPKNIGVRAQRIVNNMWENQVKPTLNGIKEKASKQEIFNYIQNNISKVKDLGARKSLQTAFESMADDYKHVSSWSYKTLDNIKSEMAGKLPQKVWKGQDITANVQLLNKMFSDKARIMVRSKLPKEILTIYDEYGSLKELATRGAKGMKEGITGGALSILSKEIKAAVTPLTTGLGLVVGKTGTAIKKAGQRLLKK